MESRFKALGWAYVVSGALGIISILFMSSHIQRALGLIRISGFPGVSGPSLRLNSTNTSSAAFVMLLMLAFVLVALAVSKGYSIFTRFIMGALFIAVIVLASASIGLPSVLAIILALALAILLMINGYGILVKRPWAQPLTVALSILLFFVKPVGTVIAVFGLWVMVMPVITTPWDHYTGSVRRESASGLRNSSEE